MADAPISLLPVEATVIEGNDFLAIDKEISPGVWETQKVKVTGLPPSTNIYNTNDTLTGNRILYGDNNDLNFLNLSNFRAHGNGTTLADVTHTFENGIGTTQEWYGDGSTQMFGNLGIGATPNSGIRLFIGGGLSTGLFVSGNSQGIFGSSNSGYGGRFASSSGVGGYFESTTGDGGEFHADGTGTYAGKFIASGSANALSAYAALTHLAMNVNGRILTTNLPTSPTGLSTGEFWNWSGSVGIV